MEVFEAIRTRRDMDAFASEVPPRDVVARLIDAGVWAPNHRHTEPWRFHVLAGDGRTALAEALARWLEGQGRGDAPQRAIRAKLVRSPVVLVVSQVGTPDDSVRDREDYAACMCAVQNILLAAHAEGLIAHFSTDRTLMDEGARAYLGLAPADRLVAYLHLGYRRDDTPPPEGARREPVVQWAWPA
ncbi:MAG: nitroreductase [Dehalococcoidia bacterium]